MLISDRLLVNKLQLILSRGRKQTLCGKDRNKSFIQGKGSVLRLKNCGYIFFARFICFLCSVCYSFFVVCVSCFKWSVWCCIVLVFPFIVLSL